MARVPIARYGIAEWFGKDITKMTPEERQICGQLAARQDQTGDLSNAPVCPFLATLISAARCNKASGVCSIRKFTPGTGASGITVPNDQPATVCPSRFLQASTDDKSLFVWISEKMLDISNPTVVKETPFLRKVSDVQRPPEIAADMEAEEEGWSH